MGVVLFLEKEHEGDEHGTDYVERWGKDGPRMNGKSRDANFVPRRMPFVKCCVW